MTKFNPKIYKNKKRVYSQVAGNTGVSKLWIWNPDANEYLPPVNGKAYLVRKRVQRIGRTERVTRFFSTLAEARTWKIANESYEEPLTPNSSSPQTFKDVLQKWKLRDFAKLRRSTQVSYDKIIQRHFSPLLAVEMNKFDTATVDLWVDSLLKSPRTHRRANFRHEFGVLSTVLRFHSENSVGFVSPFKRKHKKDIKVREATFRRKDLTENGFLAFRDMLVQRKHGAMFAALATVQYYQALRVSEVTALHWDDISIDVQNPSNSRLSVSRSTKYIRVAKSEPTIERNFKNSVSNGGMKIQPLFKQAFEAVLAYQKHSDGRGLVFGIHGKVLTYRQVQSAYDLAFKKAGLEYSGTHIMRHGGCRRVFDKSRGDIGMAKQVLGNQDMRSVMVYAERSNEALSEFAKEEWNE